MSKIVAIIHGRLSRPGSLKEELEEGFGASVRCVLTERVGHARELALAAALEGANLVIAVGGDGTVNEVVNGLVESGKTDVTLGIWAKGTGNDFVRSLGLSGDVTELAECYRLGRRARMDVGACTFVSPEGGGTETRYVANIADIGIGGVIAERLSRSSRWLGAFLTYQSEIVRALLTYRKPDVRIKADSFEYRGRCLSAVVANGRYFGGALGIAPEASLTDGTLQAVVIGDVGLLTYLRHLPVIRRCQRIPHPEVQYHQVTSIRLAAAVGRMPIDVDGEFVGYTPLLIEVIPAAIWVLGRF